MGLYYMPNNFKKIEKSNWNQNLNVKKCQKNKRWPRIHVIPKTIIVHSLSPLLRHVFHVSELHIFFLYIFFSAWSEFCTWLDSYESQNIPPGLRGGIFRTLLRTRLLRKRRKSSSRSLWIQIDAAITLVHVRLLRAYTFYVAGEEHTVSVIDIIAWKKIRKKKRNEKKTRTVKFKTQSFKTFRTTPCVRGRETARVSVPNRDDAAKTFYCSDTLASRRHNIKNVRPRI